MAVPVTVDDAARQLRLEPDEISPEMSAQLGSWVADAAAWVEDYTGQVLVARDVTEQFRGFGAVNLRAWPVAATAPPGVAYADGTGAPVAIVGARLDVSRRPARVLPPFGPFYSFRDRTQLFTVTIRAGYEAGDVLPGNIRRAMLVLIAAYDADREGGEVFAQAEKTARSLCSHLRLKRL